MDHPDKLTKYTSAFWDQNPTTSDAFEVLTEHVNKSFEMATSVINILELQMTCYDSHAKSLAKLSKSYSKTDKTSKYYEYTKAIVDSISRESEINAQFCVNIDKNSLQPLKESVKAIYDKFKKRKIELQKRIKERKNAFETAAKSCKNYSSKFRAHVALEKKSQAAASDEKTASKISKCKQGVTLAEKEARVGIEMLNTSLFEYQKDFVEYCQQAESADRTILSNIAKYLKMIGKDGNDYLSQLKGALETHNSVAGGIDIDGYINTFLREKGTNTVYTDKGTLTESGDEMNREFTVKLYSSAEAGSRPSSHKQSEKMKSKDKLRESQDKGNSGGEEEFTAPKMVVKQEIKIEETEPGDLPIGSSVEALFEYKAANDDELTLHKGDILKVIGKEDSDWYIGQLKDGTEGIFPGNYVKVK